MKIKERNHNLKKSVTGLAILLLSALTLAGCKEEKTDKDEKHTAEPEITAEVTTTPEKTEAVEPSEEPSTEPVETPVEELSLEEWIATLKTDDAVFFVFNEVSGERKVLEDGEEYTVSDGDVLGFWYPSSWKSMEGRTALYPMELYLNFELKYEVMLIYLDDVEIEGEINVESALVDTEGNEVIITAYLIR